jgi:hypothetical protein
LRIKDANLIWKFADQKVNGFDPANKKKCILKEFLGVYLDKV